MKTLSLQDKEFLMDIIKHSANKYYCKPYKLSITECVLLACKELGYSVTPTTLSALTYHIKNGREI